MEVAVHDAHQVLERQALEDPPDPVHVDALPSAGAAVSLQVHGCAFLEQTSLA